MDIIENSLQIALQAHTGQKDKAGKAYILHPLRVMAKMETEEEMSAALLHDVIEDSNYNAGDLLQAGIPEKVVEAVSLLSKPPNESYEQFIDRIRDSELASKIKKADIEDNINILRLDSLGEKELARIAKYHKAWKKLNLRESLNSLQGPV